MLGALQSAPCGAHQFTCCAQATCLRTAGTVPEVPSPRMLAYRASQQSFLGNLAIGMRSVNTLRAALPVSEGTAQVLQEWSQQSQHRQHDASSQAAAAVPRKPAAKRRRRQLNIVPDPGSASQQGYNTAMSSATSQQNRMSGSASHSGTFPHHRQGNAKQGMRAGAKPSGTQVRSLATAEMLLAHAHLLQQLQRSNPLLSSHSSASAGQVFDAEQAHSVAVQDSSSGQTASQHTQSPTAAPDTLAQQSGTAEQDMLALQVDLVDNQLPHWSQNQPLDWSAQQDISVYQPQLKATSNLENGAHILSKFLMNDRGELVEVQPLWIAVHQEAEGGPARLYETVHTLQPEVLEYISQTVQPFCTLDGLKFSKPKFSHGPWKAYLVGVVGDVAAEEDNVLWPNRMFCGKRVVHNVRNGWDIARFLAEPTLQDMDGHHSNLSLLQSDKKYHPGWVWHMLKARWGDDAVSSYCNAKAAEQLAAQQQASRNAKVAEQNASQQAGHRRLRTPWAHPARRRALQFA